MVLKIQKLLIRNKAGHKKFIEEVKPDFVKLTVMVSFCIPNSLLLKTLSQLICKQLNLLVQIILGFLLKLNL